MNSEDKFRESLNELLSSKEFPFDESEWRKASEMIEASKKKRRSFAPFIFTGLLLLIPMTLFVYFAGEDVLSRPSMAMNAETNPTANQTLVPDVSKAISANASTPVTKPQSTTATPNRKTPVSQPETIRIFKPVATPATAETKPVRAADPSQPESPAKTHSVPTIKTSPVEKAPEKTKNTKGNVAETSPFTASPESQPKDDQLALNTKKSFNEDDNKNANNDPGNNEEPTEMEKSPVPPAPLVKPTETAVTAETNEQLAQTTDTEKKDEAEKAEPAPGTTTAPAIAAVAAPDTSSIYESPTFEKRTLFSFESGISYLVGYKNPGARDAESFNPVIGLNYYIPFSNRTILSLGAQYTYVDNLGLSSTTIKRTKYRLGEESNVTVITPSRLHYISAPLRMHYLVGRKNVFGLGINLQYLLTSVSTVETYYERMNRKENYEVRKAKGYVQGFSPFDAQVTAFYRRRLIKDLWANIEVMYGLTDVKDNKFFKSDVFERNSGIKFTLIYSIFKK